MLVRFLALRQPCTPFGTFFQREETEALLLGNASNAFNSLDLQTALHNIQSLSLSLATALINTCRAPSELYVDGDVEGTTQGDPPAMPMYALAPIPQDSVNNVNQVWYADVASGAGKVNRLREWWDQIWIFHQHNCKQPHAAHTAFTHGLSASGLTSLALCMAVAQAFCSSK